MVLIHKKRKRKMCGIIARMSIKETSPIKSLLGLKELEYRGYDSYGILISNKEGNLLSKNINCLNIKLLNNLKKLKSNIEIGHTRWATHGEVTQKNAHPHFDKNKQFFIVMNGIIENYDEIKQFLKNKGYKFITQTDTEILPHLYSYYYELEKDLILATKKVIQDLKGEFSFLLKYKNNLLGYKNINPIIIGKSENEIFLSSDLNIVENNSENFYILKDNEIFISTLKNQQNSNQNSNSNCSNPKLEMQIYNSNFELNKNVKFLPCISKKIQTKKHTKYYMEKEIRDQKNLKYFLTNENINKLKELKIKLLNSKKKIFLIGAGTSYNAANFMHYTLLELGINSQLILASELSNYSDLIKDSIIIIFSQSGETADLISPLKSLKLNNKIISITNTEHSTLDRYANLSLYLNCGKEIAVASTKAFLFQIFVAKCLKEIIFEKNPENLLKNYEQNFDKLFQKNKTTLLKITNSFHKKNSIFYIGRSKYFPLAIEGALKLKEISYIHAEGFAGGELKHGSLALIEKGTPVIVMGSNDNIISNAIEIKTRGGILIGVGSKKNDTDDIFNYYLETPEQLEEIYSSILLQELSFRITCKRGLNPDKPRNLAKSVTVK